MAIVGRSTYPAGSALTEVSGGGDTASAYLQAMLAREAQQMDRNQRRRPAPMAAQAQMGGRRGVAPPQAATVTKAPHDPNRVLREQAEAAALRGEIMKRNAASQGAPMRMTTFGGGTNNFYTPDVGSMNAYQKELYLPQGSEQINTPGNAASAQAGFTSDAAWQAMMREDRERGRAPLAEAGAGGAVAGPPRASVVDPSRQVQYSPPPASQTMNQYGERDPRSPVPVRRPVAPDRPPGWYGSR